MIPVNPYAQPVEGRVLLTASYDNMLKLWSTLDWACTKTLAAHDARIMAADFSPGMAYSSGIEFCATTKGIADRLKWALVVSDDVCSNPGIQTWLRRTALLKHACCMSLLRLHLLQWQWPKWRGSMQLPLRSSHGTHSSLHGNTTVCRCIFSPKSYCLKLSHAVIGLFLTIRWEETGVRFLWSHVETVAVRPRLPAMDRIERSESPRKIDVRVRGDGQSERRVPSISCHANRRCPDHQAGRRGRRRCRNGLVIPRIKFNQYIYCQDAS